MSRCNYLVVIREKLSPIILIGLIRIEQVPNAYPPSFKNAPYWWTPSLCRSLCTVIWGLKVVLVIDL